MLDGLIVLDPHGSSLAIAAAGRRLAELGATVIVVEQEETGGAVRRLAPDVETTSGERRGLPFLATCQAKRWVALDGKTSEGQEALDDLGAASDIVLLSDSSDPWRGRAGTIVVSPFGSSGPRTDWKASSQGLFHVSGPGSVTPRAPQTVAGDVTPPTAPYGFVAEHYAGSQVAATAIACSLSTEPRVIELSMSEVLLPLMRRELAAWWFDGYVAGRSERLWRVAPSGLYPTSDGCVYVNVIEEAQWCALCELMERPELIEDERYSDANRRFEHIAELDEALAPWFANRSSEAVFAACGSARVPVGPAFGPADLMSTAHALHREVFADSLESGVSLPAPAIRTIDGTALHDAGSEEWPRRGRDTASVLESVGWSATRIDSAMADGSLISPA